MPIVKINGVEVEVEPGTNMIEAAAQVGVDIPHYCYHPHLSIAGNCRMCLVDVEAGGRGPDIACNMQARDGLAIRTDTEQVETMRRSVQEFLLKNHPLDCPICDQSGECRLQDYYMEYGQYDSRLADTKVVKEKRKDIGDELVLDQERCVACSRCVRFGDEVTETGELRLIQRTDHTSIDIFPGERIEHRYQGNLADICPVGALTLKDFRFKKRVWYLRETASVCGGCASGCNIKVCHEGNEVHRYLPRRNDAVNQSWMCDPGRKSHASLTGMERLVVARSEGRTVEVEDAARAAAEGLTGQKVGVVLGARATNEANWALAQLAKDKLEGARFFLIEGNDGGAIDGTDDFLLDSDKTPNRRGAALIGAAHGEVENAAALKAALADGSIDALVVLQDDALGRLEMETGPNVVVLIGTWRGRTSTSASVILPAAAHVEQDGTWINRRGRVQRLFRATLPAGDSLSELAAVAQLGRALGAELSTDGRAVFASIAAAVPELSGMSWRSLGDQGQTLVAPTPPTGDDETGQAAQSGAAGA